MNNYLFYIDDINLLTKAKALIKHFDSDAKIDIFEDKNLINPSIDNHLFIIDTDLEYFQKKFIGDKKNNCLIIINDIIDDLEDYPVEVYISKNKVVTSLSAILYDIKNSLKFDQKHFSVSIDNIMTGVSAPCDLYLRVADKCLKIFHQDDLFDDEAALKFKKKSQYIWVKKEDFYLFGNFLYGQKDLEQYATSTFSIDNLASLELIYEMAKTCGISKKTISAVNGSIDCLLDGSKGEIKELIKNFQSMKGSFLYSHSYFTALVCVEVASQMSWFKRVHIDKLVLASIFHDLGYKDIKNAIYEGFTKTKVMELEGLERDDVLNHVDNILEVLLKNHEFDNDVINIIKKHHGARGLESYPTKSYATEIDSLSGVFILSHTFTNYFYKSSFNLKKLGVILSFIELTYNKGNMRQILTQFLDVVKKMLK